jgi:hypothetical protein
MAFTLHDERGSVTEFGDRASYSFNQAGFLVVVNDDGTLLTFSPHAWHHLEDVPKGGYFG